MKIAVYSCNFGNYRQELVKGIDRITFHKEIDYYFFTDVTTLKSRGWNIIIHPTLPPDDIMDSLRWTTKHIKFILPDILKPYDMIIWIDNKMLGKPQVDMNPNHIAELSNMPHKLFNVPHPQCMVKTQRDHVPLTLKPGVENIENARKWLAEIKDIKYPTRIVDSGLIVRRNDSETNALFERVFGLLKEKGLKRDQNVYNHAIYETNYPLEHLCFIGFNCKPHPTIKATI